MSGVWLNQKAFRLLLALEQHLELMKVTDGRGEGKARVSFVAL